MVRRQFLARAPPRTIAAKIAPPARDGGRGPRGGNETTPLQRGNFGGMNLDEKQRELLQEARQVGNDDLRKLNEKLADAQKEYVKAVVAEKYDGTTVGTKSFATVSPTLKPEQRESLEGNARIGIAIINPTGGFVGAGGPGGNFGGGRTPFGGGGPGGVGGERGAPGAPGAPGKPASGNERRRGRDN